MIIIANQPVNMIPQAMVTVSAEGLNLQPEEAQVYPPANNYTSIRDALLRLGIKATYRAIQSDNFVEDVSGWKLAADGVGYLAEGNIGGWNINATTIYSDGNNIILDSANKKIESGNYVSGYAGAGFHLSQDLLEVGNIACRGLIRTAVFQKDVISSVGGNFMVIDSDMLDTDMTALDASTLITKATTTFLVGDFLRIKDGTDDEWLEVLGGDTVLCDSYSESNQDQVSSLYSGSDIKIGQSFTGDGKTAESCKFYIYKSGSPTGNAVATIYAHTGTFGSTGTPTGPALATSDNFDVSTLTGNLALVEFNFTGANKITLTNGTHYFIVLEYSGGDVSNKVVFGFDTSGSHSGNVADYDSSWGTLDFFGSDLCFYIYTKEAASNPYNVARDKNSDYAANINPTWKKGATIVNYGQNGDGGIFMTASESNAPYLSVFTHAGSPWSALTTRLRIGNLNGYLGYSTDKYGIGIGDTDNYLKFDPTDKLQIKVSGEDALKIGYGSDILLEEGGDIKFTQLTAPTACVASLVEVAGNIDAGTHEYKITFVSSTGETELGAISNTVTNNGTHEQNSLTNISVSSSGAVTSRKIYRTKAGDPSEYFLLTTISDNTTTIYTDNIADANLTGEDAGNKENDSFGKVLVNNVVALRLGTQNTFVGKFSGDSNQTGGKNVGLGYGSLYTNSSGQQNTAIGHCSLFHNTTGSNNTGIGDNSLNDNITGNSNVAIGAGSLANITAKSSNVAIGFYALNNSSVGDRNIAIGRQAGPTSTLTDTIALGYGAKPITSHSMVIGNSSYYINDIYIGAGVTSTQGASLTINASGKEGTNQYANFLSLCAGKGTGNNGDGGKIRFRTPVVGASGSTLQTLSTRMDIDTFGNVTISPGGIATDATGGFLSIPVCSGTPTGIPYSLPSPAAPMVYDRTNNKLYIYDAGWKGVTLS